MHIQTKENAAENDRRSFLARGLRTESWQTSVAGSDTLVGRGSDPEMFAAAYRKDPGGRSSQRLAAVLRAGLVLAACGCTVPPLWEQRTESICRADSPCTDPSRRKGDSELHTFVRSRREFLPVEAQRFGPENVPVLIDLMMDACEREYARGRAAVVLGVIGGEYVVAPSLQAIRERHVQELPPLLSFVRALGLAASLRKDPVALQFLLDHTHKDSWRALSEDWKQASGFHVLVLGYYTREALSWTGDLRADAVLQQRLNEAIATDDALGAEWLRSALAVNARARTEGTPVLAADFKDNFEMFAHVDCGMDGCKEPYEEPLPDVRELVRRRYIDSGPRVQVERYGPENIPILMDILMDTKEEAATRMEAAGLLGVIGDERIVDPILQIIEEGGLTTYGLPYFVYALGNFASRRRDSGALQFLLDHTREADWRALSPLFTAYPSNVLEIYAHADRIALSRTGDLRADEIFWRLLSEALDGNRAEEARALCSCLSDNEKARIKEAERLFDVE